MCLMISACLTTTAPCALGQQAPGGSYPPLQASAAMTLYHVLVGANGQQYYLNQYGQAIPLPGAGSADSQGVAIYTGSGGESWYVDKNGQQVDLPPLATPPPNPAYYGYQGQSPYYSGPPQGSSQQQPNINIVNQPPPSSSGGSGSSGLGTALAAGLGAAAGAFGGAAMDMAMGGIPYGMPIYPGIAGGAPYYMGADGNRVFVNKTVNNNVINNWSKQSNWYNKQVNETNGRYNNNNWPGREHGFPPPGQQVPGRLYQPTPGGGQKGNLANRGGGGWGHQMFGGGHMGGDHFGGGGGFGHFGGGGFGGGHFGGLGRR